MTAAALWALVGLFASGVHAWALWMAVADYYYLRAESESLRRFAAAEARLQAILTAAIFQFLASGVLELVLRGVFPAFPEMLRYTLVVGLLFAGFGLVLLAGVVKTVERRRLMRDDPD